MKLSKEYDNFDQRWQKWGSGGETIDFPSALRFVIGIGAWAMAMLTLAVVGFSEILVEGIKKVLIPSRFRVKYQSKSLDSFWTAARGAEKTLSAILLNADQLRPFTSSDLECIRRWSAHVKVVVMASESGCPEIMSIAGDTDGVILTSATGHALVNALELILLGQRVYPGEIFQIRQGLKALNETPCRISAPALEECLNDGGPAEVPISLPNLSEREVQVVNHLCNGSPNKIIARELGISEATVKVHVKAIFRKTKARNRTEAALLFSSAIKRSAT